MLKKINDPMSFNLKIMPPTSVETLSIHDDCVPIPMTEGTFSRTRHVQYSSSGSLKRVASHWRASRRSSRAHAKTPASARDFTCMYWVSVKAGLWTLDWTGLKVWTTIIETVEINDSEYQHQLKTGLTMHN